MSDDGVYFGCYEFCCSDVAFSFGYSSVSAEGDDRYPSEYGGYYPEEVPKVS